MAVCVQTRHVVAYRNFCLIATHRQGFKNWQRFIYVRMKKFSVYLVRIWPKSVWAEEGGGWKRFLCIVIGILEYWKRFGQGINLLLTILLNRFCCCWKLESTWFCAPLRLRRNILVDKFSNKWTPPIIIYTENNAENWVNTILDQWSVNKLYKTRRQVCWVHTHFTQ